MTPPPPAAAAARAAPAVHPRRRPATRPHRAPLAPTRRPRRVSGPARPRRAANPSIALAARPLLDRLIQGRIWIVLVAFALIGIVTMQLGLLKLNAGIGRALQHEAALQRENSALSVEASEVAASGAVELQAAHMGMRLIPSGALRFLSARGSASEIARAVAALSAAAGSSTAGVASTTGSAATAEAASSTGATPEASATSSEASSSATTSSSVAGEAPEGTTSSSAASSASPGTSEATPGARRSGGEATAPTSVPASAQASGESGGASPSPRG
ncbi:MAG TPA: hypothetical protein VES65_02315 [Solirubrobacteraceae bacterium]|nr:hypothetical protein [Solirubrobacteraceae bacterium]